MPEPQQETWVKLVTLTVIVLAVASGVSAFKAIGYATRAQIFAAREARQWQDYQVESVYKDNFNIRRDILALLRAVEGSPLDYGYPRTTWTQELLIKVLADETGIRVSRTTMCRASASCTSPRMKELTMPVLTKDSGHGAASNPSR